MFLKETCSQLLTAIFQRVNVRHYQGQVVVSIFANDPRLHIFPSVNGIELDISVKLLGVWIRADGPTHVDYMLSLCSQWAFVLKRLRDQGLTMKYLHNVFSGHYCTVGFMPYLHGVVLSPNNYRKE